MAFHGFKRNETVIVDSELSEIETRVKFHLY